MYKIGICDDGNSTCAFIENVILQYAEGKKISIETHVWYTGEELCEYLRQGHKLDLLFLDIELFELSGMDVGAFIRTELEEWIMQIVYISSKQSYAQQLFQTQPMDFLVKPISEVQIEKSLELAWKILGKNVKKFEFQSGSEYYRIPYGEILYVCSEGRQIMVRTTHGEIRFYGKLNDVRQNLTEDFIDIHKSFAVNKKYIWQYTYSMVELENKEILNISHAYRKEVRERLLKEGW